MTPRKLFNMLVDFVAPTRMEVIDIIEDMTRNYEPERVEVLLADFADMLFQWQCDEAYNRAKWEYDEKESQHRAKYDEGYSVYVEKLRFAEYALAMGTNEHIEWPEEPEPYEPLPFIPPMPGTIADNIHIPAMYSYAVELLKDKTAEHSKNHPKKLPPELSTPDASTIFSAVEDAGYCSTKGEGYKWESTTALLAYFIDEVSRLLELRPSNDRIPWSKFAPVFNLSESTVRTCRNEVSKYTTTDTKEAQKDKPEGWRELKIIIDKALRDNPT